jgi:hypothetical protein
MMFDQVGIEQEKVDNMTAKALIAKTSSTRLALGRWTKRIG